MIPWPVGILLDRPAKDLHEGWQAFEQPTSALERACYMLPSVFSSRVLTALLKIEPNR